MRRRTPPSSASSGGYASANAISAGTLHSHVDGQVTAGTAASDTYSNLAVAFHRAHSNAVGFLIALGAVGVYSHSTTSPDLQANMGDGASAIVSGNAYTLAITEDSANPTGEAKGIPAANNQPDGSEDKPTLTAGLGTVATLRAGGSSAIETIGNMNVVPNLFPVVQLGPSAAAGNHPPTITSPDTASVASGTTSVLTVTATDPNLADNAKLTYSIIEEANATSLFAIDPTSGALSFMTAPTYDSNTPANNTYVVEVAVGDQDGAYDFQFITITVTPASQLAPPSAADVPTGPGQTTDDPTNAATDNPRRSAAAARSTTARSPTRTRATARSTSSMSSPTPRRTSTSCWARGPSWRPAPATSSSISSRTTSPGQPAAA